MSPIHSKSVAGFFTALLILMLISADYAPAQDGDRRINDDTGTATQIEPAMAANSYGQAIFVWTDNRDGKNDVFAQIFTHRGHPNKKNFKVNDSGAPGTAVTPDVAINALGHFIVVWESRDDSARIYAQKYYANGVKMGNAVRVDEHARSIASNSSFPSVGMDRRGRFAVCWTDLARNNGDVFMQRFDSKGNRQGGNVLVNNPSPGIQKDQAIAMNEDGDFVVVWTDDRLSTGLNAVVEIFAQRYTIYGQAQGNNFRISHSPAGVIPHEPAAAMQANGEFMVCWFGQYAFQRVCAASFDANGAMLSKTFAVSDTVHPSNDILPDICPLTTTSYILAWRNGHLNDIVLRQADRLGNVAPAQTVLTDDLGSEFYPSLAYNDKGIFAAFTDNCNGHMDIYAARIGPDVPINVYAGANFAEMVPVTWDHNYSRTDISRYRIARREGASPFVDVATVDLSTRGLLGASMRDWIDTTVVADHTYSYIVTGLAGDNPYPSMPTVATPAKYRPRIGVAWAYKLPAIDGLLGPGEWADAEKVTLGNPFAPSPVNLFVKYRREAGQEWLYVAIDDPNDEAIDPANAMGILFDLNSNGKWDTAGPSKEGMIAINSGGATFTGYWGAYPNALGADATKKADGIEYKISTESGHVQYEVALNLKTSPLKISGFGARAAFWVTDPGNLYPTHYGNAGEWPLGALWECAATLGDLMLAVPVVVMGANDWPMSRKNREQWAYGWAEHSLEPPFQHSHDYGEGLGFFREMAVYQTMLFATAKQVWTGLEPWKLHAFDIPTGSRLWSYTLPGSESWAATHPAVNDSLVLVGDGGSGKLYALGRRSGVLRWQKSLPRLGYQDPILDGSKVYIVSDSLYCLEVLSGRTVWHAPAGYSVAGILAVDESNVFYADGANLGCWDKATGSRLWLHENSGQPSLMVDEELLYAFHNDAFYFRRKSDGSHWWGTSCRNTSFEEESNVLAATDSFALVREPGYGDDMDLFLVNKANSDIVWGKDHDSTYIGPPAIANSIVYYRTWKEGPNISAEMRSSLTALNLWTGETVATIYDSAFITDPIVAQGKLFIGTNHSIRAYSNTPITGVEDRPVAAAQHFVLIQNYPNPFNPSTTIRYQMDRPGKVTLRLYNAAGQLVRIILQDSAIAAGSHEVHWDGRNDVGQLSASGVYIARLQAEKSSRSLKILLIK